jgi:hypothetical protein
MADSSDIHNALSIIYAIHDSIISNPDTPQGLLTLQLTGPGWSRVFSESFDPEYHSPDNGSIERLELAASARK